ncbi:MAG: DUF4102 domain-containing protein [Hahellaceae bacterium]|nr:DUF4102 domain-containing protein [Hahellaceae bacterium]
MSGYAEWLKTVATEIQVWGGKEKLLTWQLPQISLKQARTDRDEHKALLRSGIDPSTSRKEQNRKPSWWQINPLKPYHSLWLKIQNKNRPRALRAPASSA